MATPVFLDPEDEITSAAARIRDAADDRLALVLPFGSRLATSRMNFRLLAREARTRGRRLDIVAPDGATRALAASAGLPVFASIAEWESAIARGDREPADETGARDPNAGVAAGVGGAGAGVPGTRTGATNGAGPRGDGRRAPLDDTATAPVTLPGPDHPTGARGREPRVVHARGRFRPRRGTVLGAGLLGLAVLAAGAAAWIMLPAAEITVTPRLVVIGPIELTVRADPTADEVNVEGAVIPATTITIPVRSSGDFAATGVRLDETPATGGVRWTNCDPTAAYRIPEGSIVRTSGDVRFRTDAEVFLPVAILSGPFLDPVLECQSSDVAVTAVTPGPAGNVGAGTITVVPSNYNRNVVRVTNPQATSGGTSVEHRVVAQADVDAALAQLASELEAAFTAALEDPVGVPSGATVFPATAQLGPTRTDLDPAALVDQELEQFSLQMAADGTVVAVDEGPLRQIAEARLQGSVRDGFELVDGSSAVTVGEAAIGEDGVIRFPVTGYAQEMRPVDADALRALVTGRSRADAEAALAPYGTVEVSLWPDWVTTVPTIDQRLTLVVAPPSGDPIPTPGPSTGAGGEQPVPSP